MTLQGINPKNGIYGALAWQVYLQNINFLTCSNAVSALEMTNALVEELLKLEEGIIVYDCVWQWVVVVLSPVMAILCDNARASELLNHLGARAIKFCRKCMVTN